MVYFWGFEIWFQDHTFVQYKVPTTPLFFVVCTFYGCVIRIYNLYHRFLSSCCLNVTIKIDSDSSFEMIQDHIIQTSLGFWTWNKLLFLPPLSPVTFIILIFSGFHLNYLQYLFHLLKANSFQHRRIGNISVCQMSNIGIGATGFCGLNVNILSYENQTIHIFKIQ